MLYYMIPSASREKKSWNVWWYRYLRVSKNKSYSELASLCFLSQNARRLKVNS